jgi:hypothetical protein
MIAKYIGLCTIVMALMVPPPLDIRAAAAELRSD